MWSSHQDFKWEGRVQGLPLESSLNFGLFSVTEVSSIIGLAEHWPHRSLWVLTSWKKLQPKAVREVTAHSSSEDKVQLQWALHMRPDSGIFLILGRGHQSTCLSPPGEGLALSPSYFWDPVPSCVGVVCGNQPDKTASKLLPGCC